MPGPRTPPVAPPRWDARPFRILVVRVGSLGDTILVTSLLRAIAESHAGFQVDALVRAPYTEILRGLPFIQEIVPFDCTETRRNPGLGLLARIRRAHYDVVVDTMISDRLRGRTGFSSASMMVFLASRAPYRVGQAGLRNSFILNLPVDVDLAGHMIDRGAALATPFGVDVATTDWRPEFAVSTAEREGAESRWARAGAGGGLGGDRGRRLLVNASAQQTIREWRDDRYVEVIRRAVARHPGLRVIVTGFPAQRARIESIAALAGVAASIQPVREAFALAAAADVILTNDTGMVHIASAVRRPTVALLPKSNRIWTPYGVPGRNLFAVDDASLDSIAAVDVSAALEAVLTEQDDPAATTRSA